VGEVASFAKATENYGTLPGEPMRVYATVDAATRLLDVSGSIFSDPRAVEGAWGEIARAHAVKGQFTDLAAQADQALAILDTYSQLLTTLSSDEFTNALDKSATELGKALDKDIKQYNETFRDPQKKEALGLIGSTAAAAVRGGGGLYIRYRQARLLKEHVTAADPVIAAVTSDVRELITKKPDQQEDPSWGLRYALGDLRDRLRQAFFKAANRAPAASLPASTMILVGCNVADLDSAEKLCDAAARSADQYAKAHAKLRAQLMKRRDLKDHIAEIQVLAREVQAAEKLKKSLEK
jgi:hypothetical protein